MDTALGLTTNQSTTYTITQVDNLFAQKHPLITAFTNLTVYKLSRQIWEPPTGLTDVFIKSPRFLFGSGSPHTILGSLSQFYANAMFFYNPVQFWYGLQTVKADASANFFARFLINQSGDVYTYGNIECAETLTIPTYTTIQQ